MVGKLILSFKGRTLDEFLIPHGAAVIGSAADCEVHIDSLAIEPRHTRISRRDDGYVLEDLQTPGGTFVNGRKISVHPLRPGDIIRVGKHTLTFSADGDDSPGGAAPGAASAAEETADPSLRAGWLQITSGKNMGKTIRLTRSVTNIGQRGRQTAMIARRNDGYYLSHLQGESPPRVGDRDIGDQSWALQDGDIIQLGDVKMQFYLTEE